MAILRMCIATITIGQINKDDRPEILKRKRPKIYRKLAGKQTDFLIDSVASVLVCSEKMFKTC